MQRPMADGRWMPAESLGLEVGGRRYHYVGGPGDCADGSASKEAQDLQSLQGSELAPELNAEPSELEREPGLR